MPRGKPRYPRWTANRRILAERLLYAAHSMAPRVTQVSKPGRVQECLESRGLLQKTRSLGDGRHGKGCVYRMGLVLARTCQLLA